MMKKITTLLFLLTTVTLGIVSCDSDDDLPTSEPVQFNTFCYGDQTTNFEVIGAFRGQTTQVIPEGIKTDVTILGDGLSLNDMDEIEGAGVLMQMNFYGNSLLGFQTGLYEISDLVDPANVSVNYSLDFDTSNTFNTTLSLDNGFVRVQTYLSGYSIAIDGVDSNGDDFHGVYIGNVSLIE